MTLKEIVIKDVKNVFESGDPSIHPLKFTMWIAYNEENLMKLSQNSIEEFRNTVPEIVDIIISDYKKHYNIISKNSVEFQLFVTRTGEWFDKNKRMRTMLTDEDFDYLMDSIKKEYEKYFSVPIPISKNKATSQSKEGCYIATMAYKNYDHPNVIIFRNFRDTTLKKNLLGRCFIKTYYFLSPKIVSIIKYFPLINRTIKLILDKVAIRLK